MCKIHGAGAFNEECWKLIEIPSQKEKKKERRENSEEKRREVSCRK